MSRYHLRKTVPVIGGLIVVLTPTIALCLLAVPIATEAQQTGKVYRIGALCPTLCVPTHPLWQPGIQGLRDFGWIEGQNFVFDFRHALGQAEQLPRLAAELVSAKPDVLFAPSPSAAQALKNATRTIPIVFVADDPVQSGFVVSLARPGGNMTGLTVTAGPELDAKRLQLFHEAIPRASRIAVLATPWYEPYTRGALGQLDTAAKSLGVRISRIDVRQPDDLDRAMSTVTREGADALFVLVSPLTIAQAARIGELAAKHRIPAMTAHGLVTAGYLLSYAPNWAHIYRRSGYYIDKILRGSEPANLPVEQPTTFELVINMQMARTLNLTVPHSVLIRADKVIE